MLYDNRVFVPILNTDKIDEMLKWCEETVGLNKDWRWSYVDDSDLNSDVAFYFKDPKFATLFALRWLDDR